MTSQIDPEDLYKAAYRETQGQPVDTVGRYTAVGYDPGMTAAHNGAWVSYTDHAAIRDEQDARIAELLAADEVRASDISRLTVERDEARAECEGLRAWQPIETAPKDGTWIVAYRPNKGYGYLDRVVIVRWDDDVSAWVWPDEAFDVYEEDFAERVNATSFSDRIDPFEDNSFTHWTPLLPPPDRAALSQKETGDE